MTLAQHFYRFLTVCALPVARCYLRKRAKKQPAYLEHWDERFGQAPYPSPRPDHPRLWVHAVSLGETVAAQPIVEAFLRDFEQADVLLTSMTPTGRESAAKFAQRWPDRVQHCYLPYDTAELMGRFFDQTRPTMGLVMETEVWPNMIGEANARGITMVLANARESEKSARLAARFGSVMRAAFAGFDAVLAQSSADAQRIRQLGARQVHVVGSVKFDIKPDAQQASLARFWRRVLARRVVLIASSRDGEEAMFAPEIERDLSGVLVVLVPRHPQRFDEVADLLAEHGISFVRRSAIDAPDAISENTQVLLGDTMGEMSFYCALADVCIMGGSYAPCGCQNLIEPAAACVPVIVGPSSFNFAKAVEDALAMGAAVRVPHAQSAWQTARTWLEDGSLPERARRAREFAVRYTGATQRHMLIVRSLWNEALSKT